LSFQERTEKKKRLAVLHRKIAFFGTPAKDYMDSGLWIYLKYVRTKDEHDALRPVKPLPTDPATGKILPYLLHIFHQLLRNEQICLPKSRQIMVSWVLAIYGTWFARTAKHRKIIWQSKKEDNAAEMVCMGGDDMQTARMSFIELNLTNEDGTPARWLSDPKIISGKGVGKNKLLYKNGSLIKGVPQGGDQVRQEVPSLFMSDESAFQDEFGKAYEAAQACINGGGRGVYASSAAPGYFCDLVNDYDGFTDGEDPPYLESDLPRGMDSWMVRNNVYVLRTHYTADPHKDPDRLGKKWIKKASAPYGGTQSPGWQQEFEINWKVAGGSPVFPQAQDVRWSAIIPARDVDFVKKNHFLMAGFDYGSANDPSVFEVIAVDEDGRIFFDWEWYKHGATYLEAAEAIKECPYWDRIRNHMVADNSIWAMTQNTDSGIKSIAQLFNEQGVHFIPGKRGTPSADVRVEEMFRAHYWADFQNPKAFITLASPKMAECVKMLRWEEHKSEAAKARAHAPLKIVHKNNDPWDASSYPIDLLIQDFARPNVPMPSDSYGAHKARMKKRERRERYTGTAVGAL